MKTAALGEGRRVGEPLYTPPRTSQVRRRGAVMHKKPYAAPKKSRFPISTPHWRKIALAAVQWK